MATRKSFPGAAETLALNAGITAGDPSMVSSTVPTAAWPTPGNPFVVVIDPGGSEEKVLVTARSSSTFTITRGYDGTTAVAHSAGIEFKACWDATAAEEANKAAYELLSSVTAKGDIPIGAGSEDLTRRAVGADNTLLYGDSGQASGWNVGKVTEAMVTANTLTRASIAAATLTDAEVAAANKDGAAGTASMRTLGTGAAQAAAGNDARLSDSRAPTGAAGGQLSGTYPNPTITGGGVPVFVPFSQSGTLVTGTGKLKFRCPVALTVQHVRAVVNTAPTGAAILVDVNKNGTTIFTTQANRPTIAISATTETATTAPDVTSFAAGDLLSVDIDQVGSTVAGSDLVVTVYLKVT